MVRFMVKASEYKNVCKAVNDRKLAELKKEIIEILKKQDENEVKKAVDYFNSQELHYTHLEKSLVSGKWIEKAGYGVGTVRIWKGKKYKKIAPGKWARVFDKEGRGTNIAIGKLIARVQKIDNVEDLMAFVMANKQRFVDENGVDLPVLDKLRAAVGVKNENLSGESSSYTNGVGEDVSREKNKIFEGKEKITKEEADLHKVSRKLEQIPTTELKQRKAKLERWIENKTRNKRDSLNNAIFRESYQKELDAINAVLDKRNEKKETSKPAEKYDDSLQQMIDNSLKHGNYMTSKDVVEQDLKELVYDLKTSSKNKIIERLAEEYKFANTEYQRLDKKADVKELSEKEQNTLERFKRQKEKAANQKYFLENFYKEEEKPAEKKTVDYSKMSEDELKELNSKLHDKLKEKDYDEVDEEMEQINAIGKQQAINFYKTKEKHTLQHVEDVEQKKKMIADSKAVTEKELARKEKQKAKETNIAKKNNLVDEIKELKHKIAAFEQLANEIEDEPAEKEEPKTYWIQDSRGNRLTNEDAKSRITDNYMQIFKLNGSNEPRKDIKIRELKNENEYLMERLNPEDKAEVEIPDYASKLDSDKSKKLADELEKLQEGSESDSEKHQNRSEAMKGNKNAYKGGVKEVIGTFSKVDDKTVEMPLTKDVKKIFESLNKTRSSDKYRQFMTDAYYDGENFVSTDGRRLTVIKAGDIGLEKGYVNVKTDNGKITVEHNAEKTKENQFPNYSKVIPDNNNQEVNLNKKVLLNKLKEMKQDGAYTKKEPSITLEFKDGDVILDGTVIGKSDAEFEGENKYMVFHAEYLKDAVSSSDNSTMFVSDNPEKAVSFSDDNSDIIVMPMHNDKKDDYESRRNSKKEKDDWESEQKKNRQDGIDIFVNGLSESMSDACIDNLITKVNDKSIDDHKGIIERAYKALKDAEKMYDKPTMTFTTSLTKNKYGYSLLAASRKRPDFRTELEKMAEEYGVQIKKSLFDDFVIDNFIEEDIDDIEKDKEEESLWNDYSAEQPELFNSTAMKVREALDRIRNQVM